MKVMIAGGTGFIGKALRRGLLHAKHEVIVLTRGKGVDAGSGGLIPWDGKSIGRWATCLEGADAVINLAGENIAAKRWTPARKRELVSSRVDATRAIVDAIAQTERKPSVLINISAVGYYGDAADRELTEESQRGGGFLADICAQWEAEARKAESFGVRVVLPRLGPVMGERGGMLSKMILPFRLFIGAPLGTGKQWIPWVHIDDVAEAVLWMLSKKNISGPVNIASGNPVTMEEFCRTLARILRRPCWPPLPSFFIKMLMGEMAVMVLSSQKVRPRKLLEAGYSFRYSDLSSALKAILQKTK